MDGEEVSYRTENLESMLDIGFISIGITNQLLPPGFASQKSGPEHPITNKRQIVRF